jgi:hypothetical protein
MKQFQLQRLPFQSYSDTVFQFIAKQPNQNIYLHNSITVFILKMFSQPMMVDDRRLHNYICLIQ